MIRRDLAPDASLVHVRITSSSTTPTDSTSNLDISGRVLYTETTHRSCKQTNDIREQCGRDGILFRSRHHKLRSALPQGINSRGGPGERRSTLFNLVDHAPYSCVYTALFKFYLRKLP
ncbi:uncharacterized protein ARMOST_15547 [Armillaria ostoyae]|uniref:Uncharacterized protein n=1 Tax=Armillaria ostoyae TaxID=47428 RepID=A0A284RTP8_ARMOS|nr:uncharacterized protein ARMOST_15547 [Armillaria ostoyae]